MLSFLYTMGLTPEEHLNMLKKQQERREKLMAAGDVILTNVRFYGSALLNTAIDLPTALRYFGRRGKKK